MPDRSARARHQIASMSVAPANGATIRDRTRQLARRGDRDVPRMDRAAARPDGGAARTARQDMPQVGDWRFDSALRPRICQAPPAMQANNAPIVWLPHL